MCDKPPKKPPKCNQKCAEAEDEQECPEPAGKRRGPEPQNYCKKRCSSSEPPRRKPSPEPEPVCDRSCPKRKSIRKKKCAKPEPEPEPACREPEPVCKRACPQPCKKKCPEPEEEPVCKRKICPEQGESAPKKKGAFACKPLPLYKKPKPRSLAKGKSKPVHGQYVAAKTKETSLGALLLKDMFKMPRLLRMIGPKHVAIGTVFVPSICVFSAAWFLSAIYIAEWRALLQYMPYYGGKYEPAESDKKK